MKSLFGKPDSSAEDAAKKARKEAEARRKELEAQQTGEESAKRNRYRGVASLLSGSATGYPTVGSNSTTLG